VNLSPARRAVESLVAAGVDFAVSVPCGLLGDLLDETRTEPRIEHLPVTREEEGIGLCAGVALAGRVPCIMMQNSGLGNCLNAIASLTQTFKLPLLMIIGYRGDSVDPIVAQHAMGRATPGLLEVFGIPTVFLTDVSQIDEVGRLARLAASGQVVALVVHRGVFGR
jgi:sulfopyruvate decarboxylase subunit alpha